MTKEGIVNLCLRLIGAEKIGALSDSTKQAIIAREVYDQCLRECFEIPEDWFFAIARAKLSRLTAVPLFGSFNYMYSKPNQCCRIINMVDENGDYFKYDFSEEVYVSGSTKTDVILTNQEEVFVKYIVYRDEPNIYPAWFCKLIAAKIAVYLAAPLRGGQDNYTTFQIEKIWRWAYDEAKVGNSSHQLTIENNRNSEEGNHDLIDASSGNISILKDQYGHPVDY
jgi:hypothetical protein